ncbi:MAG: hypothetical protein LH702_29720 [Phormidesmis sp. CAN_BIN44]|nr:hypothetical protein [Phormidesmis sp. CAN_BIN44]
MTGVVNSFNWREFPAGEILAVHKTIQEKSNGCLSEAITTPPLTIRAQNSAWVEGRSLRQALDIAFKRTPYQPINQRSFLANTRSLQTSF